MFRPSRVWGRVTPVIRAVRTPDECFSDVPDFPYTPHYREDLPGYEGLRMAWIDEGSGDRVALCLHGEPSWSFLYRKMMPVFLQAGLRVVAPDFFGFGRSDKPVEDDVYTYDFHRGALLAFVRALDLRNITLVCQDWGGILGLTLPVDEPDRIQRLIVMNTGLPTGQSPGPGFDAWRQFMASNPELHVGRLMKRATPILSDTETAAYQAPFPSREYLAGVRRFPQLVPTDPDMDGVDTSEAALEFWRTFDGKSFMAIGMQDPVLGPPVMRSLRKNIQGCPEPMEIADGGHFVQEWGEPIARAALEHFGDL
ncbi:MAG: haloalkane dehalogenase [Myxococcota bacterium]